MQGISREPSYVAFFTKNARKTSLHPLRVLFSLDIILSLPLLCPKQTLSGGRIFSPKGLTKGQKYAIIPNATQEYYNIFLRKTHGLLLAQLIRVSFVLLQTNRITSFLFNL
jgi:hypothetical protein